MLRRSFTFMYFIVHLFVLCMSHKEWRSVLLEWSKQHEKWRATMQLILNWISIRRPLISFPVCFDWNMSCSEGKKWYWQTLQGTLRCLRRIKRNFILTLDFPTTSKLYEPIVGPVLFHCRQTYGVLTVPKKKNQRRCCKPAVRDTNILLSVRLKVACDRNLIQPWGI